MHIAPLQIYQLVVEQEKKERNHYIYMRKKSKIQLRSLYELLKENMECCQKKYPSPNVYCL